MIWVEILSRHHDVIARHKIDRLDDHAVIRIGRGYDNDVVIDDAYVAPHHLTLTQNADAGWSVQDNSAVNGLILEARGKRAVKLVGIAVLTDDTVIRIGKTLLRIRTADSTVAAERALPAPQNHTWRWPLLAAVMVIGIEMIGAWLGETGEPKLSRYITSMMVLALIIVVWTTVWSLVSRLFSGYAQFERHLLIALCGLLAFSLLDELSGVSAFAFSWQTLLEYEFMVRWLVTAATIFFHLRVIGASHMKLKAAGVVLLACFGVATGFVSRSESKALGQANYLRQLKTPMMRLVPEQTDAEFFADAEKLKAKLDIARKEEKPDGGLFNVDVDD